MTANSIVVIVDGLRASWLGPYGNTWFETPHANQLGAESVVYEHCVIDEPTLRGAYRSFWRGTRFNRVGNEPSLSAELSSRGVAACLISDEPDLADCEDVDAFDQYIQIPPALMDAAAPDVESTAAAQLVAAAYDAAQQMEAPFHLWLHLQGLAGLWDAPYEMRAALASEEDPAPPRDVSPPTGDFTKDDDPDRWFGWLLAAAAQVQVIDMCLGWLASLAEQTESQLCVSATRGYPLGEHGVAGLEQPPLHQELLHVPLMSRFADGTGAACRHQTIVQGAALYDLIRAHHGLAEPSDFTRDLAVEPAQQLAVSVADNQLAIRTAAWKARFTQQQIQLYSKPDDRLEVNEVADRCVEEVEAMTALRADIEAGATVEVPGLLWKVEQ